MSLTHHGSIAKPTLRRFSVQVLSLALVVMCYLFGASNGRAAERAWEAEPYDLLTVAGPEGDRTLQIYPLKFPGRTLPTNRKPSEKFRVRIVEDPDDKTYEIAWKDVKELIFFEDFLVKEAARLTVAKQFDEAYDCYRFLLKEHPDREGVRTGMYAFWYLGAADAFQNKRYDEALAILEELLRKNPKYEHGGKSPSLLRVLDRIVDKLVQRYIEKQDYRSARTLLARVASAYDAKKEPFYEKWRGELERLAAEKRDAAREHLKAERFTEAYDSAAEMAGIWEEVTGGPELVREIALKYPRVVVAVSQAAGAPDSLRIENWASRRAGRLTDRRLVELTGIGAEGGTYRSPIGECVRSEDGKQLLFSLNDDGSNPAIGFELSRLLLSRADPREAIFSREWAVIAGTIAAASPKAVEVKLRRPYVIPQALLQISLSDTDGQRVALGSIAGGSYRMVASGPEITRFALLNESRGSAGGQPREIVEKLIRDPEETLLEFERGEIQAVDRISLADLERYRAIPGAAVEQYAVPTIHALVPNTARPWPMNRSLRRAVSAGIDRKLILEKGILRETKLPGAMLTTGPFPKPGGNTDTLDYAFDSNVPAPIYQPHLALLFASISKKEALAQARAKKAPDPKFTGLTIGHPPTEAARIACRAMVKQLAVVSLPVKLIEFEPGVSQHPECDFQYAEWTITEPAVDAVRLFGAGGTAATESAFVRQAIGRVQLASNWLEAGTRLREVHRVVNEDLTILPLWQLPEFYAYRRTLTGIGKRQVTFYQEVEQWRIGTAREGSRS